MRRRRWTTVMSCLAMLALSAVGCGDDDPGDAADTSTDVGSDAADDTDDGDDTYDTYDGDDVAEADTTITATDTTVAADTMADTSTNDTTPPAPDTSPLGGDRPAKVHLPNAYDAGQEWPLIILLHGYSATGFVQDTYLRFSAQRHDLGFVAVVPDGTVDGSGKQFWNASPAFCCDFQNSGVDDVGYLLGLIDEAKERFAIDANRVYFIGHSNGGFMSYKMACEHADVVAGMMSIAGSSVISNADCAPTRPVTVLQVHGTDDPTIEYNGTPAFPSAETLVERWSGLNGCTGGGVAGVSADFDSAAAGDETTPTLWDTCDDDVKVGLWTMTGSGHIPGFVADFMPAALGFLLDHERVIP